MMLKEALAPACETLSVLAEARQKELVEHLRAHSQNPEEVAWASKELEKLEDLIRFNRRYQTELN